MQRVDNIYKIYNFASIRRLPLNVFLGSGSVRVSLYQAGHRLAGRSNVLSLSTVVHQKYQLFSQKFENKEGQTSGQRVAGIPGKPIKDLKDQICRGLFVAEAMIVTDRWRIEMSSQCNNVHKRCMLLT